MWLQLSRRKCYPLSPPRQSHYVFQPYGHPQSAQQNSCSASINHRTLRPALVGTHIQGGGGVDTGCGRDRSSCRASIRRSLPWRGESEIGRKEEGKSQKERDPKADVKAIPHSFTIKGLPGFCMRSCANTKVIKIHTNLIFKPLFSDLGK